ncbi:hypothetical protein ASG43_19975 [Aureimonas sp. Leaf454]|nr:hypothetical protein ASG43_19975 [Aureimonas sp. Leaf454]
MRPIRWHLLVFAVLILLPQIVLGAALGSWYSTAERHRLEDAAGTVAAAVRSQLDRELEAMKATLQALATSPNVEAGDFEALRAQSLELLKFRGTAIAARDRSHQQVMNTFAAPGAKLPISTDPALIAADEQVFASGLPAVSDLYVGAVSRKPFVLVDVPLRRGGEVRYALNMAISPVAIRDMLLTSGVPDGWTVSVVDRADKVIARSKDHDTYVGQRAPAAFVEARKERFGRIEGVVALDGTRVVTAYDTLDTSGWRVAVGVPEAALAAPLRAILLTLAAVSAVALASSAILAHLYSRRLEGEVRSLQTVATKTGLNGPVERKRGSVTELEAIADALSEADATLKERDRQKDLLHAELNHRVRNTLSVLRSVVNQTIRGGGSGEALAVKTVGRIMALSRAHDLLSSAEWAPVALSELIARTAEQEGLAIGHEGDDVMLRPEAVPPLAQALHELAVNERLHGGRGARGARHLTMRTCSEAGRLRFEWGSSPTENVSLSPPGFGLRLVRLCLERQLFGTIERLDGSGMTAVLPLEFLVAQASGEEPFAARFDKS